MSAVVNIRKTYEDSEVSVSEPVTKRQCVEQLSNRSNRVAALEVCDMIVNNINERFQFSDHLCVSKLFLVEKFPQYCVEFPENDFQTTIKYYPTINGLKLRTELEVLYSHEDLCIASGATPLLVFPC